MSTIKRDLTLKNGNNLLITADPRQRAWVEVDPSAIEANTRKIIGILSSSCQLMAVVKADGYGHGAETVARAALKGGANSLGVATLQEGIELRKVGLECPILVLGNLIDPEDLLACLHSQLMPTLSTEREAFLCQKIASESGRKFCVQLKFDTGMTRLGCDLNEAPRLIEFVHQLSHIELKGVYSHLALADEDLYSEAASFTSIQKKRFESVLLGVSVNRDCYFHLANSAGTLRDTRLHFDMVRVGLALYGYSPIRHRYEDLVLEPALSVKARISLIRQVESGVGVSYGHNFVTERSSRVAVVGIGYADGINQKLSGKIYALFKGRLLPQIGAITMDQLLLDVTDCPDLTVGSVVTLLGKDGHECITLRQWSDLSGSIPWEVLCSFKNRLPRLLI